MNTSPPAAQLELRERARTSATDLLKTVVGLSTGAIAVIFALLSGENPVRLPSDEAFALLLSAGFFVLADFAGLFGWLAHSQYYYQRALTLEGRGPEHERKAARLKFLRLSCFACVPWFFCLAVGCAGAFILFRVW